MVFWTLLFVGGVLSQNVTLRAVDPCLQTLEGPSRIQCGVDPPTFEFSRSVDFEIEVVNAGSTLYSAPPFNISVITGSARLTAQDITLTDRGGCPVSPSTTLSNPGVSPSCRSIVRRPNCLTLPNPDASGPVTVFYEYDPENVTGVTRSGNLFLAASIQDIPACTSGANVAAATLAGTVVTLVSLICCCVAVVASGWCTNKKLTKKARGRMATA